MSPLIRQIIALAQKDLRTELREPDHFVSLVLFAVLLLLLFSFALSIEPTLMRKMAPGLFWLTILFASLLNLERSFQKETEDGQWEGLLLLGMSTRALYLGKVIANLILVLALQLILLPLLSILFDIPFTPALFLILFLGSLGLVIPGTCYAGLTASLQHGQILLPLLLYPMLVPVLLAAVKVTELNLAHDLFGQQLVWLQLLILFDSIFLLGSLLMADILFDNA